MDITLAEHLGLALMVMVVAFFIGGLAGFGSGILSIPPLIWIYGQDSLTTVVMLAVTAGLPQVWLLTIRNWKHADRRFCMRLIGGSAIGIPLGMLTVHLLPATGILILLGLLTFVAGVTNIMPPRPSALGRGKRYAMPIAGLAGVIHGAFGSGGTILVAYVQRVMPDKNTFRATLVTYWAILNLGFVIAMLVRTKPSGADVRVLLLASAVVFAVTWVADHVVKYINQQQFRVGVSALLMLAGVVILINAV